MKTRILMLVVLMSLIMATPVWADDGETHFEYLPLVAQNTPRERFVISRADCEYIIFAYFNPSLPIQKNNYAGSASVSQHPTGLPKEFPAVHYWYTYSDPSRDLEIVYYYSYFPFKPGFLYWLNGYVKEEGGLGLFWVLNANDLWLPCPLH